MGKKINEVFFETYKSVDKACCDKFGVDKFGVTEYITRLNKTRFAPMRDEVLPLLVKYRNIRNSLAHDEGSLADVGNVTKYDVKWLKSFEKQLQKKKDPLSVYLRKAYRHRRLRKLRNVLLVLLPILAAAAAAYYVIAYLL